MTLSTSTVNENLLTTAPEKWNPRPLQKRGVKWILDRCTNGLFADPGAGKTSIVLKAIVKLKEAGEVNKVLILAPKKPCITAWLAQVLRWKDFNGLKAVFLHGPDKDDTLLRDDHDIYILNYEGLKWFLDKNYRRYDIVKFDMLVVDESTKFKNTNTKRFKAIKEYITTIRRRTILSGTPLPKNYINLFGQCYVMDSGYSLGKYITQYRFNYFYPSGFNGYDWKLKPGADREIMKVLSKSVLRMDEKDYSDLPPHVENPIAVDLPEEARNIYKELEKEFYVKIGSSDILAANSAVAGSKCRQICSGAIYNGDSKSDYIEIHDEKLQALTDLVEELDGEPVLVSYEFVHEKERIVNHLKKEFGKNFGVVDVGDIPDKKFLSFIDECSQKTFPVVLGHPASIGLGTDGLQKGIHHIAIFTATWDAELWDQYIRRLRREGQKKTVFVHIFYIRDSVEEVVMKRVKEKLEVQKSGLQIIGELQTTNSAQRKRNKSMTTKKVTAKKAAKKAAVKKAANSPKKKAGLGTLVTAVGTTPVPEGVVKGTNPPKAAKRTRARAGAASPVAPEPTNDPVAVQHQPLSPESPAQGSLKGSGKRAKKLAPTATAMPKMAITRHSVGKLTPGTNSARVGTTRHELFAVIMKCKTIEEALKEVYTDRNGVIRRISPIDIKVAIDNGAVTVSG